MASFGVRSTVGLPSISTSPESGRCTPDRILISVDLPAPLSPTRPIDSPWPILRLTSFRAWTPEYHLCRRRHSITGGLDGAGRSVGPGSAVGMGWFMGHLQLDATRRAAQPRIPGDGQDGEKTDRELEPVGV